MLLESKTQPETMGNNVGAFRLELEGTYDCKTVYKMAKSGNFRRNCIGLTVMQKWSEKRSETKGVVQNCLGLIRDVPIALKRAREQPNLSIFVKISQSRNRCL